MTNCQCPPVTIIVHPSIHDLKKLEKIVLKRNLFFQTTKNNHFTIGSINVQTAKCEVKLAEYTLHVKNIKNDIYLFQETHKIGSGEIEFDDEVLKGWKVINSGFKKKA